MAILNRTLDTTEQRLVFEAVLPAAQLTSGVTSVVAVVPFPCVIDYAQAVANGLSGAPTWQLNVDRFIAGTGFTTIIIATGSSNTPPAFGTSGVGISGMVLVASGSTLRNLLANDQIMLTTGAANTAAKSGAVCVALRPIQDVIVQFGFFAP